MDLVAELESMATNAAEDCDIEFEPSDEEIQRWRALFAYSYSEAVEQIKSQKGDYSRCRISDEHWDLVKLEKEAQGYSRDAYEHWIGVGGRLDSSLGESPKHGDDYLLQAKSLYLVLLEGILSTPKCIQEAANLSEPPHTVQGASETRDAVFCKIDGSVKQSIETWLSQKKSTFRPTFVRVSKAKKDLDPDSIHPTLGLESTLPHHRFSSGSSSTMTVTQHEGSTNRTICPVHQDEYPVWYFFYGTLADPAVLTHLLSLPETEPPVLIPASISGGSIKSWKGRYKALVDGASTDYVYGSAYVVTSREHEDALLTYETEKYEVVRCCIRMRNEMVQGLTFRFVGDL